MTSIGSISTSGNAAFYQVDRAQSAVESRSKPKDDPMARVADALGLSHDELKSQLGTGKSLSDVATDRGVTHDELISAIKSGISTSSTSGTSGSADAMAEQIAAGKGVTPPPQPAPAPRGENAGLQDPDKLKQVSDLLDMDTADVTAAATSASSLVSMLQTKGVDLTQLKDVLNRSGDLLDVRA
ncbi:hypothetical protein [Actinoplanes awajinensis]|uniref:Uncharacterized protein n=1 Tax=Actinoplanes awajinensis subsp. mycoplanecinus TaxID=135947 RepID=A0A0X3V8N5_9ACTN|nr:hypothetical protein [Actinoplanes awajinensis]KUL40777.1 hypothetical protein ADL15_06005 [Actinoplanes awajinensis subsp. mycoplanecinus]